MKRWRPLLVALLCLLCTLCATAQSERRDDDDSDDDFDAVQAVLQTDRPIIIRVPDLENHNMQIELDVLVSRSRDGTPTKVRFPVLYRVDTGPDTELRLQTDFLTIQNPNVGFGDISLGAKWQVGPNTSLLGIVELPTGSAGFGDPGVEPTVMVVQSFPLSKNLSLNVNAGVSFNRDAGTLEYYGEFDAAAELGYSLTPTTQLTTAILFKTPDAFIGGINRLSGAVGISHAIDLHNRLNLTLGRSFSSTGDDYLVLFGWAHKI